MYNQLRFLRRFFFLMCMFSHLFVWGSDEILNLRKQLPSSEMIKNENQDKPDEIFFFEDISIGSKEDKFSKRKRYQPPFRVISLEEITQSKIVTSYLSKGAIIIPYPPSLSKNQTISQKNKSPVNVIMEKSKYVRHYKKPDHQDYFYLLDSKVKVIGKVHKRFISKLSEVLKMHEPPISYQPVTHAHSQKQDDGNLKIHKGFSWQTGISKGDYIGDLLSKNQSQLGYLNQLGIFAMTSWRLPVFIGLSAYYENTNYQSDLSKNSKLQSFTFGPLVRTKVFNFKKTQLTFSSQIKIGPFTHLRSSNSQIPTYRFYSTDLLNQIDIPFKNIFGQFSLGAFFQIQWLNIKNPPQETSLSSRLKTNKTFGLSLSQVFDL